MPVTKIVYRFRDASVPPRYHRSYTISITASDANVVVNSYGKQLNESMVKLSPSQFQAVLDVIEKSQITLEAETEEARPTIGGKIEYLQLFDADTEVFSASTHRSGTPGAMILRGNIKVVRQTLRSLFPNFQSLLK